MPERPELRIISRDNENEEISSDALSVIGYQNYCADDYQVKYFHNTMYLPTKLTFFFFFFFFFFFYSFTQWTVNPCSISCLHTILLWQSPVT